MSKKKRNAMKKLGKIKNSTKSSEVELDIVETSDDNEKTYKFNPEQV